ncbi:MAG: cytochrome c biogenesis protein DipZ, partial [Pseudomonadota bacterium]
MVLLIVFAFLGGIVTILSPCILPVLPIVLSGTLTGGKKKPLGVVTGFVLSFTFFTLFLTTLVKATGVSADALRTTSVFIIGLFGVSLLLPKFQVALEKLFSRLASIVP